MGFSHVANVLYSIRTDAVSGANRQFSSAYCLLDAYDCRHDLAVCTICHHLEKRTGQFKLGEAEKRLWLNHPVHPKKFKVYKVAYTFTLPIILYAFFFENSGMFQFVGEALNRIFPFMAPQEYTKIQNLMAPEFVGALYLLGIALVSCLFNYLLGEELFFRGILLPQMKGAFGRWDWAMNGVLFAFYHLHKITDIPMILIGSIFFGFLNVRYRSFWPSVIIHGVEAIPVLVGVIAAILGIML